MNRFFFGAFQYVAIAVILPLAQVACTIAAPAPPPEEKSDSPSLFAIYCLSDYLEMEGAFFVPLEIATTPAVREQLGLNDTQVAKIKELVATTRAIFSEEYPARNFKGVNYEMIDREAGEARKRMMDILKPHQAELFKKIVLREFGILSMQPRDLRQLLTLTPDQEYQFDTARSDLFVAINRTLRQPLTRDGEQICQIATLDSDVVRSLLAATEKRVEAHLTPEQKETMSRLQK